MVPNALAESAWEPEGPAGPSITLTFERMPTLRAERFCARIAGLEPLPGVAKVAVAPQVPPGAAFVVDVGVGQHTVRLTGFVGAAPKETLDRAMAGAQLPPEQQQAIARHTTHVVCDYADGCDDPVEQYLALYKVAWGFAEAGLTAVLNAEAWTCQPAAALAALMKPAVLAHARKSVPLGIWTGVVKIRQPNGVWIVTRGHERFEVPNFAYLARDPSEAGEVLAMFSRIFAWVRQAGDHLHAGQTIQLAPDGYLAFGEAPLNLGLPSGGGRTLCVERAPGRGLGGEA